MLKNLLKFSLAIGLITWLIRSGKLDFSLIPKVLHVGPNLPIAFFLLLSQGIIASYRYKMILEINMQKKINFFQMIQINWIGMFFSSILPGAVTGDFIKLFYIKKQDEKLTKTFLLTSIMIDRILGLIGLLFICAFFSTLYYSAITKVSPQIAHIININFLLFAGAISFFAILLAPKKVQKILMHFFYKIPKVGHKIVSIFEQIFSLNQHRIVFIKCFVLSVIAQSMGVFAFWFLTSPFYEIHLPFQYAYTFIPFGLIAIAIPISPAGLGVGHALFQNLFSLVGIHNGASLFNLNFILVLCVNLLGVIPYLLLGIKPTEKDMEQFKEC